MLHLVAATAPVSSTTEALSLIAGVLIPLLVGVITKMRASEGLKAIVNAGLSAVAGALTAVLASTGAVRWQSVVISILSTWIVSVASHYGFWKPTGASQAVQSVAPTFGLGRSVQPRKAQAVKRSPTRRR